MSTYSSSRLAGLVPYVPGEQPQDRKYLKLNTNESPFPPSPGVRAVVEAEAGLVQLYSDPECKELRRQMSLTFGLPENNIIMVNGSDEVLNFAFMAFADEAHPLVFPDITYGFYPVFAELNRIPYETIPLRDDFSLRVEDYLGINKTIVFANPNAPTGLALPLVDVERIVAGNPHNVVIVDEAYVDFGGESARNLVLKYDNLLVTGTFSKSYSMAGARLGFGFGSEKLIGDLNTIRYSTNPYNVNRFTSAAGCAALREQDYYMENCREIMAVREWTTRQLEGLGFEVLPSRTNFVFARTPVVDGAELYTALKENGVLIRHFSAPRIADFNRITIGSREQMELFVTTVKTILEKETR